MIDDQTTPLDQVEFDDPNEELFFAIIWCDQPGASGDFISKIKHALAKGADINGFSEDGMTPLTEAIEGGMGSPKAVKILLENGANPSLRDQNNSSPWAICAARLSDNVVKDRMEQIKTLLIEYGADQSDEIFLQFTNAVKNKEYKNVQEFIDNKIDVNDLQMNPLRAAIQNLDVKMMKLLLDAGTHPDGNLANEDIESCLITAAGLGSLDMVKLLTDAGADTTKHALGDEQYTADQAAREGGHHEVADWLTQHMPKEIIQKREEKLQSISPKFREIYEKGTNGINYEISNEDVIVKLTKWDKQYSISVSEIEADRLTVQFDKLPEDLNKFANEIYEFCPDVIDQGYGCIADMIEMSQEHGHEVPAWTEKLIEGVDLSDENCGLKLLQRELKENKSIAFWWD